MNKNKKDTFIKVHYVVVWTGCKTPLKYRFFENFDEALELFNEQSKRDNPHIEELATKIQVKTIFPL